MFTACAATNRTVIAESVNSGAITGGSGEIGSLGVTCSASGERGQRSGGGGFCGVAAGDRRPMFLFAALRFGRMGPLGIAYTGYRLWRRLSPEQKQALRARAVALAHRARAGRGTRPTTATPPRARSVGG
jgi:hypothetical protein